MITSQSNPLVKRIKRLHTRGGRRKYGQYFIEGVRGVEQVLENGAPFNEIVYSSDVFQLNGGKALLERLQKLRIPIAEVSREIFTSIADTETPQYIMAVLKIPQWELDEILQRENLLLVIVDRIQDPGNLGTIIRTADAVGADGVILLKGTTDPYNPKSVRSTMGSIFSVPIIQQDNVDNLFGVLRKRGITIVATSLDSDVSYFELDYTGNTAIIIGSEAGGVSEEVSCKASISVKIPMLGKVESLNAAVACGVILYKALEQRLT